MEEASDIRVPIQGDTWWSSKDCKFKSRLHALPQELFNLIHDYTFTVEHSDPIVVDKAYKPPAILQVNSLSRANLLDQYYAANTFDIQADNEKIIGDVEWSNHPSDDSIHDIVYLRSDKPKPIVLKWWLSIPTAQRANVGGFQFHSASRRIAARKGYRLAITEFEGVHENSLLVVNPGGVWPVPWNIWGEVESEWGGRLELVWEWAPITVL
jgi:hypothetical protein